MSSTTSNILSIVPCQISSSRYQTEAYDVAENVNKNELLSTTYDRYITSKIPRHTKEKRVTCVSKTGRKYKRMTIYRVTTFFGNIP